MTNSDVMHIRRVATTTALRVRRDRQLLRDEPVDPFDFVRARGVALQYLDAKSLEGMFTRAPDPMIFLPSTQHRPFGRICFSCAHELGHFELGHILSVDEVDESGSNFEKELDEIGADTFAQWFLMPRQAVESAFERLGVSAESATPLQLLAVSQWLNVSLAALINHMTYVLTLVSVEWRERHIKLSPKKIQQTAAKEYYKDRTVVIFRDLMPSQVIVEVGDRLLFVDGQEFVGSERIARLLASSSEGTFYDVCGKGVDDGTVQDTAFRIKSSKKYYVGHHEFRYLEGDADDEP